MQANHKPIILLVAETAFEAFYWPKPLLDSAEPGVSAGPVIFNGDVDTVEGLVACQACSWGRKFSSKSIGARFIRYAPKQVWMDMYWAFEF